MTFSAFQNSGSFRRNLNLREQNGSGSKVIDRISLSNLHLQKVCLKILSLLCTGPHFVEYLGFAVTPECDVLLRCKVRLQIFTLC